MPQCSRLRSWRARESCWLLAAVGAVVMQPACAELIGIEELPRESSEAAATCELPTEGAAALRFGHLLAGGAAVDYCVKPSSESTYAGRAPLLAAAGAGCPEGFAFTEFSRPVSVPFGTYDVKAVPHDARDCTVPALAERSGISVGEGEVGTVVLLGAPGAPRTLVALPESPAPEAGLVQLRFVHAATGHAALDFGPVDTETSPRTLLGEPLFSGVAFGETGQQGTGPSTLVSPVIDERGYARVTTVGVRDLGVAEAGVLLARSQIDFAPPGRASQSIYAFSSGVGAEVLLLACDELQSVGHRTACRPLFAEQFTAASVNARIFGFDPYVEQRREDILAAIAGASADVLCVQGVWEQDAKEELAHLAAERFPHAVFFEHDLDTPVDDPTDLNGQKQLGYQEPPCADPKVRQQFGEVLDCAEERCNTTPGSSEGRLTNPDCAVRECGNLFLGLGSRDPRCGNCAAGLQGGTFGQVRDQCQHHPNGDMSHRGQSSVLLLSRVPLLAHEAHVIPGSALRRVILRAELEASSEEPLAVYCTHLTWPVPLVGFGYTGVWGSGARGKAGFEQEQLLQASKLVRWVEQRSAGHRALVLGEFNAGREYRSGSSIVLEALAPEVMALLESAFTIGVRPDYVPACTVCVDNPSMQADAAFWSNYVFGFGLARESIVAGSRAFDEYSTEAQGGEGPLEVPTFAVFGFRSTIGLPR